MGYADDDCMNNGGSFTTNQLARARCNIQEYLTGWLKADECTEDKDCSDDNGCTIDTCVRGLCSHSRPCEETQCGLPGVCLNDTCGFRTCEDTIEEVFKDCATASCVTDQCKIDYSACVLPENECCETSDSPMCNDPEIVSCVCKRDPECCSSAWNETCILSMASFCKLDCSTWIETQDMSQCNTAPPLVSGFYLSDIFGYNDDNLECNFFLDREEGWFFRTKGLWSEPSTVLIDACGSSTMHHIVVFQDCGTSTEPSSCVSYTDPGSDDGCAAVLDLMPGVTYKVLLVSDYPSAMKLDVTYTDLFSDLQAESPINWDILSAIIDKYSINVANAIFSMDYTNNIYPWSINDLDRESGILSVNYDFDPSASEDDITWHLDAAADLLKDVLMGICGLDEKACGVFSVNAKLPNGLKRATGTTVHWVFTEGEQLSYGQRLYAPVMFVFFCIGAFLLA
eukprot:TRINITY_DN6829_c0_g1_i1.p1 TRINITY_DN6829_c0_g1~~TRINITY_DN6829_c0_g1_i1.p1  ORF type:complete len:454 (-),score=82.26 TRINITY_DN6829_c0_g1_i1:52-1413(-)